MAAVIEREQVVARPTGAALGADIEGIDLAGPLSPEMVATIKQAWGEHLVLRFRRQHLSDDDLMRFSRHFGELDWAPIARTGNQPSPCNGCLSSGPCESSNPARREFANTFCRRDRRVPCGLAPTLL